MPDLNWFDVKNKALIPSQSVVQNGKVVRLQGSGYGSPLPDRFTLYRVPSKMAEWILALRRKATWKQALLPHARPNPKRNAPQTVVESAPIPLASAGAFHAQRWVFTAGTRVSPMIRTARTGSAFLKAGVKSPGGPQAPSVHIGINGTLQAAIDPYLRVEPIFPWSPQSPLSLYELIREEISASLIEPDLLVTDERPQVKPRSAKKRPLPIERTEVNLAASAPALYSIDFETEKYLGPINSLIYHDRPSGVEYEFEGFAGQLDAGSSGQFSMNLRIDRGVEPFAMAFAIINDSEPGIAGASEVVVVMDGNVYFCEG